METIRAAVETDIQQCAALLDILFSQEHEFRPNRTAQERGLAMIIGHPSTGTVFVCEENGSLTGMLLLLGTVSTALGAKVAMLEDMVVLPGHRHKGIGSRLIAHACAWARTQGYERITLLTDGDNATAHRFYAGNGFMRSEMVVFRKRIIPIGCGPDRQA